MSITSLYLLETLTLRTFDECCCHSCSARAKRSFRLWKSWRTLTNFATTMNDGCCCFQSSSAATGSDRGNAAKQSLTALLDRGPSGDDDTGRRQQPKPSVDGKQLRFAETTSGDDDGHVVGHGQDGGDDVTVPITFDVLCRL